MASEKRIVALLPVRRRTTTKRAKIGYRTTVAVGSSNCADSSLGTERRRTRRDRVPLVGVGATKWRRCHSRCHLGRAPFSESLTGHRWWRSPRWFAPIRVRGSTPSRARRGPVRGGRGVFLSRISYPAFSTAATTPTNPEREEGPTQQVIAHGTPASATTVVAPFKPLSQNVKAIQAAYHPNPIVQKFRGVIFWRRYRPGRPTRPGRVRRHCWWRC